MGALIEIVLPVFLVIGFGFAAVRGGVFPDTGIDALMRFTQRFAIPCLLFLAIAQIDLAQDFNLQMLAAFYVGATVCFGLGILGARGLFGRPPEDAVAIGFCCLFSNTVLLGLPIAERAYGTAALDPMFSIIAFHSPFCYLLGITAMELTRNRSGSFLGAVPAIGRAICAPSG